VPAVLTAFDVAAAQHSTLPWPIRTHVPAVLTVFIGSIIAGSLFNQVGIGLSPVLESFLARLQHNNLQQSSALSCS
jgi:hypothetical protein